MTKTLDESWTQGLGRAGLYDTTPQVAVGLAFEESGPLSMSGLTNLAAACDSQATVQFLRIKGKHHVSLFHL